MTSDDATRLDSLFVANFRAFGEIEIDFHPELTVLVAPNGSGKTAILDAISIAWVLFVHTLERRSQAGGFSHEDIRLVQAAAGMQPVLPTGFRAEGRVGGRPITWERRIDSDRPRARTTSAGATPLKDAAIKLRDDVQEHAEGKQSDSPTLPVIAYYGTGRLWGVHRLTEGKTEKGRPGTSRISGYSDCLSSSSRYKFFVDWFSRFSKEAQQERMTGRPSPHRPSERLEVVAAAVGHVLRPAGWNTLEWDFAAETIVATHVVYGRLPVAQLSDGIRNMIGLVGDLSHRVTRLNPHLGASAARRTPGVVLIDEVDMHLHPSWQQVVIEALRQAFPAVQFIVTTHSPQVLSTVPRECIRIIQFDGADARVRTPAFQTRGVESADVLAEIMGVDPIPHVAEAQWLSDYRALIQQGEGAAATELLSKLNAHFGAEHPVMLDCARLLRFESFKRSRKQ